MAARQSNTTHLHLVKTKVYSKTLEAWVSDTTALGNVEGDANTTEG